jgi:hypothetical protein
MAFLLEWNWIGFIIGFFGAFIMEFSRFLRKNKTLTQTYMIGESYISTEKINKFAIFISFVYIAIGGILSAIFANTKQEAFLYGLFWQAIFTFVISQKEDN